MMADTQQLPLPEPRWIRIGAFALYVSGEHWVKAGGTPAVRLRIKFGEGADARFKICHDPDDLEEFAETWLKEELNPKIVFPGTETHPEPVLAEEHLERSVLYRQCQKKLEKHGIEPMAACDYMAELLDVVDIEGLKKLMAIYLPLFRKCKPLSARELAEGFRKSLFGDREPETDDEIRKDRFLRLFAEYFGDTQVIHIGLADFERYRMWVSRGLDMRNKALYCLRDGFHWARDYAEALPARQTTICDWVIGKKPDATTYEPYSAQDSKRLAALLPDREMVWAFTLNGQQFVRQEEALQLGRKHIHRDVTGMPDEIIVTKDISKTKEERHIPIEPQFRGLFKVLLECEGPFFISKNPFDRIDTLLLALGVTLSKNGLRRSCVSHAVGAGMSREDAAKHAGHTLDTQKIYLSAVEREEALEYRSIAFDSKRVRQLPAYKRVNFQKQVQDLKSNKPVVSISQQQLAQAQEKLAA
jgi:hypothetical protein